MNKGYGFVKFTSKDEADRAIQEMNHQIFQGKRIKVRESFQRNKGNDRYGDRGGRGRDDRYGGGRGGDRYGNNDRRGNDRYGGRGRRGSFDSYDSRDSPSNRRYGRGSDRGGRSGGHSNQGRSPYGQPQHGQQQ